MLKIIHEKFYRWWNGKYIPPKNDPSSGLVFICGSYQVHWTARACRASAIYFRDNHRWIIGLAVPTIVAVFIIH